MLLRLVLLLCFSFERVWSARQPDIDRLQTVFLRDLITQIASAGEVCDSRNWNSRPNNFVRAPSLGGGSNAPRPAVSVPHINVNADRR